MGGDGSQRRGGGDSQRRRSPAACRLVTPRPGQHFLGAWKNVSGQAELDELFALLAERFSHCTSYELELLESEVLGDVAYTVGFEHTSTSVDGVPRTYTLRATQIYRREDGEWKVAHRHGSAPPS